MATKKVTKKASNKLVDKKDYKLELKMNDEVFTLETNDLMEGIMSLKPDRLKTRVLFKIEKDGKVCEKLLSCFLAKQMFRNKMSMTVFLNRIILK